MAVVLDRDQGASSAGGDVAARLDIRQVGLEPHALIVDAEVRARARRAEQDGLGVQPGATVRPQLLIRGTVEPGVGIGAAVDMDSERLRAGEAEGLLSNSLVIQLQ